ncbi:hypothetical protein M422DRAFT_50672 [Sphaerobolus stellatus SS14]|uniref:Cation-transporting P-type ATPase N-terminal domain-containing protein n=1 Tax=Sphaerobolus stellatus (strain SS14) TaxID=990650 RepID=A0A0C9UQP4_SPHS4|nr:hypothetical protein M422DRAFT_50672 [Sphaerobolus stellatus SS14]
MPDNENVPNPNVEPLDITYDEEKVLENEKDVPSPGADAVAHGRSVAFPDVTPEHNHGIEERLPRQRGPEMRRELTKEERELAQAGYDHLERTETHGTGKEDEKDMDKVDIQEHSLRFDELEKVLLTSIVTKDPGASHGLDEKEAAARLATDGRNVLTPPKKKSALRKYFDCLLTMFNILLIIAGILEYVVLGIQFHQNFQNTYLGGILIAVAFLNAFIEFYQLQKADAILASFLAMIPPSCRVVRDGRLMSVPAADLVKGDVVFIRMGDKTPADLVIFGATDLKVDNSSLTGESEAQERRPLPDGSPSRPVEAENLVFNSTLVVSGEGYGIVVRTGDNTLIGQIARLTGSEGGINSPLSTEIAHFVVIISTIAIGFALVFFGIGIGTVYKGNVGTTLTFAVSVLVAFVPEGLPSVVTLLLSIAAKRMAQQNVLVKDLQGVETLGALTLLATDKTGTLTRNQMTVTNLWNGTRMTSAFQSNNDAQETESFSISAPGMSEMVDICALNSKIKFDKSDVPFEQREILGDATETGLARFAGRQLVGEYDAHLKKHPKVFEVPFNSTNKWALVIGVYLFFLLLFYAITEELIDLVKTVKKTHSEGYLTTYLKGAPERVLAKCTHYLNEGRKTPIDDAFRASFDDAYTYMASRGHRVIAYDNFASTVKGVAEGRLIFNNLKRSIQYTISHSTPEVIPQLLYVVVPIPLPLSAILILVIDLGFELFVALSFAWDPPESKDGLMRLKPRKPVNESSILSLKKRALRRTRTFRHDTETQGYTGPSKLNQLVTKLRAPFTRAWWADKLEKTENETLVDGKLLSYAYLEAGMIEFAAGIVSYFVVFLKNGFSPMDLRRAQKTQLYFAKSSPPFINHKGQTIEAAQQVNALAQAQSIVYLSVFIMQCFNVFAVKARFSFPFGRQTIGNPYNFAGIFAGACLGIFIIYTPPLHVVFGGTFHLSPLYWLIPCAFGILLLLWVCLRVLLLRKSIEQATVKDIKGLMMFPTMRTMSMRSKTSRH